MITMSTQVKVSRVSGKQIANFMLHCTDEAYQQWWPGVHLAFHTKKRYPNDLGNLVHFDEYVGKRRLKFDGIVVTHDPGKQIVWQMKKGIPLPAWVILSLEDDEEGVLVTHTLQAGYNHLGRWLDPFLRLSFHKQFEQDLQEHAQFEFTRLAKILSAQQPITQ